MEYYSILPLYKSLISVLRLYMIVCLKPYYKVEIVVFGFLSSSLFYS